MGNRENGDRSACELAAESLKVFPLLRQKKRRRIAPSVKAGITAPLNFGWYSKLVRRNHEPDGSLGRTGLKQFAIRKSAETTFGHSQDSC
jgi:hypothetical protein